MKTMRKTLAALAAFAALGLLATPGHAQEGLKDLGTFKDWKAHSYKEGGKMVCTMFSQPTKSEGKYSQRGDVYAFVTHRPSHNRLDEVSVYIGYTFKKGAPVSASIGGTAFEMFSDRGTAWTRDSKSDRALVRAMRAGSDMTIEGISSRGTKTMDVFSLSGFTAAYNAITKACGAK